MDAINIGWESSREELYKAMLANEAPANDRCLICEQPAIIRCCDFTNRLFNVCRVHSEIKKC